MRLETILKRLDPAGRWTRELVHAAIALAVGFGVMPAAIFYAGSQALGRYEGASVARIYRGIYQGLPAGSLASWIVVLGPLGFYAIFKGLRQWWRTSARLA
ncbi:MAG TPA: hypothetical protein VN325_04975 [Steroidobacteraceae bacterium]|nr:hypothetical protein [Steroidobacteraceae bacterium]